MRAVVVLFSMVGCLEPQPSKPPEPARRLMKAPLPSLEPPEPEKSVTGDPKLDDHADLQRPIRDGRLALIPIASSKPSANAYLTLHEGMTGGSVSISELSSEEVDTVVVRNYSRQTLFILGGEIIVGGHQDRIVLRDTKVPAGATQQLAVHCVEASRWGGATRAFHSINAIAEPQLRATAKNGSQTAVWQNVDRINAREGLRPSSNTYRNAATRHAAGANLDRRNKLLAQLDAIEDRDHIVGVAIAIDDRIVAIERFDSPVLFHKLRSMLLASYIAVSDGKPRGEMQVGFDDVRAFVKTGGVARPSPKNPGAVEMPALPMYP
jgi:hypothetical protein